MTSGRKISDRVFPAFLVLLPALEIAAHFSAVLAHAASAVWLFSGVCLLWRAGEDLAYLGRNAAGAVPQPKGTAETDRIAAAAALFVIAAQLGLIAFGATLWRNLNFEAAREVGCTLNGMAYRPDAAYFAACHLGYPARGYFLPALPSLLFGRHLWCLHGGGVLYPLIGLSFFARALFDDSPRPKRTGAIALTLALIPQLPYYFGAVFDFEQVATPVALSLAVVGAVRAYRRQNRVAELAVVAVLLWHAAFAYTPALALWVAGLAWLIAQLFAERPPARGLVVAIVVPLFFAGLVAWALRADLRLAHQLYGPNGVSTATRCGRLLRAFLLPVPASGMSRLFGWGMLAFFGWLVTGCEGRKPAALAVFCLAGVVAASVKRIGAVDYLPPTSIYRAAVFFPPILFCFYQCLIRRVPPTVKPPSKFAGGRVLIALAIAAGLYDVVAWQVFLARKPGETNAPYVSWASRNYAANSRVAITITPWVADAYNHPLYDFTVYFLPRSHPFNVEIDCRFPKGELLVAMSAQSICHQQLPADVKEEPTTLKMAGREYHLYRR